MPVRPTDGQLIHKAMIHVERLTFFPGAFQVYRPTTASHQLMNVNRRMVFEFLNLDFSLATGDECGYFIEMSGFQSTIFNFMKGSPGACAVLFVTSTERAILRPHRILDLFVSSEWETLASKRFCEKPKNEGVRSFWQRFLFCTYSASIASYDW